MSDERQLRKFELWWAEFSNIQYPDGWTLEDKNHAEYAFLSGYANVISWSYLDDKERPFPVGVVCFIVAIPYKENGLPEVFRAQLETRANGVPAILDSAGFPMDKWKPYAWAPHPHPSDFLTPAYKPYNPHGLELQEAKSE